MKKCKLCKKDKPLSSYSVNRAMKSGLQYMCKTCSGIKNKEWNRLNKDKRYIANMRNRLRRNFGISIKDYEEMVKLQNGLCAICNEKQKGNRVLAVDHNHKKGIVRALLCTNCNVALGNFKENIDTLHSAIKYLKYHG